MEWVNIISNTDSVIHDICIKNSCLVVDVLLWNGEIKRLKFLDYSCFKDMGSIGGEIGDVKVGTESLLLDELKQNILNGDGTLDEIANVKSIVFYHAWNETVLLEVLADKMEFD